MGTRVLVNGTWYYSSGPVHGNFLTPSSIRPWLAPFPGNDRAHVARGQAALRAGTQLGEGCFGGSINFQKTERELALVKGLLDQIGKLHFDVGDIHALTILRARRLVLAR